MIVRLDIAQTTDGFQSTLTIYYQPSRLYLVVGQGFAERDWTRPVNVWVIGYYPTHPLRDLAYPFHHSNSYSHPAMHVIDGFGTCCLSALTPYLFGYPLLCYSASKKQTARTINFTVSIVFSF